MTLQEMITDIRYRVNEPTANFWSDAELIVWLNEAQDNLVSRLPLEMLSDLAAIDTATMSDVSGYSQGSLPASFVKLEKAEINNHQCMKMAVKDLHALKHNEFFTDSNYEPYFSVIWNDKIRIYPTATPTATLYYIKQPGALAAPATDSSALPNHLHHLLVLYASARAKQKQEEHNTAQSFLAEYERYIKELKNIFHGEISAPPNVPNVPPRGREQPRID